MINNVFKIKISCISFSGEVRGGSFPVLAMEMTLIKTNYNLGKLQITHNRRKQLSFVKLLPLTQNTRRS